MSKKVDKEKLLTDEYEKQLKLLSNSENIIFYEHFDFNGQKNEINMYANKYKDN